LVAAVVDSALIASIYVAAIFVGELVPEGDINEADVFFPRMAIAVGVLLLTFLYFSIPETLYGRTPGKAVMGLRVVMEDGSKAGRGAIITRTLFRLIDYQFAGLLGGLLVLVTRRRQRLGDIVARTVVVSDRAG